MRICFVGPSNSSHIIKWCEWFSKRGHEVHVVSFTGGNIESATVHSIDVGVNPNGSDFSKLKYLLTGKQIKRIINDIKPDIINAHYATSYGMAMALSGVERYILSVWGADIYDFPKKSLLHKILLGYSLRKATWLFSTSKAMAKEGRKYTPKKFKITPFGVDPYIFNPAKRNRNTDEQLIVGTVKGLSDKYGIKNILEAVSIITKTTEIPIKLRIAGKGPKEEEYQLYAKDLGINSITTWLGFISQEEAAKEWANMDIALIPSTLESESFGVSAVEAQACGTATVITNIPGLMEATSPQKTSIVISRNDSKALAKAIIDLYNNPKKRNELGMNGREYVLNHYSMDECFRYIEALYYRICKRKNQNITCESELKEHLEADKKNWFL